MGDQIVVMITAGSAEALAEICGKLVNERLAACGNVVPLIRSIYRWEGAVHDTSEALAVIKTRAALFDKVRERVLQLHEYEVPEIIALPIADGHKPYLDWIDSNTGPSGPTGENVNP